MLLSSDVKRSVFEVYLDLIYMEWVKGLLSPGNHVLRVREGVHIKRPIKTEVFNT